jgi:hypothetical protein
MESGVEGDEDYGRKKKHPGADPAVQRLISENTGRPPVFFDTNYKKYSDHTFEDLNAEASYKPPLQSGLKRTTGFDQQTVDAGDRLSRALISVGDPVLAKAYRNLGAKRML